MKDIETTLVTIVNATASSEGALVDTIGSRENEEGSARFYLDVTSLAGTTPTADVSIVATIGGTDFTLGSFTQAIGATTESILITTCPSRVKAVYTLGGTVTDFDAVVTCTRF